MRRSSPTPSSNRTTSGPGSTPRWPSPDPCREEWDLRVCRTRSPGSPPRRYETENETMKLDSLTKLYIEELQDLYSAENQILKALPKMAKAASSKELQAA